MFQTKHPRLEVARVVELVDASDSKSDTERCAGSIPAPGTKNTKKDRFLSGLFFRLQPCVATDADTRRLRRVYLFQQALETTKHRT